MIAGGGRGEGPVGRLDEKLWTCRWWTEVGTGRKRGIVGNGGRGISRGRGRGLRGEETGTGQGMARGARRGVTGKMETKVEEEGEVVRGWEGVAAQRYGGGGGMAARR